MARAILSDAERLAWERFPSDPDPDAIGAYFTLADGEVDALRRLPTPAARLATGMALAGIRWLGFVPAELDGAPTAGVERLAAQLDVDPGALVGYARPSAPPVSTASAPRSSRAFATLTERISTRSSGCWLNARSSMTRRSGSCAPRRSSCATGNCCAPH